MIDACPITGLKNILIAFDGSASSEKALHEAINLAKSCGTKLHIMTVVEVNEEYEALAPKLVEKSDNEAKTFLDAAKSCAEREKVSCSIIVHRGEDAAHFIVEEAERLKADMIVMGKHGRKKGLRRLLIGSVTEKVISHAGCKVLIVPN
ncbi:MAG: universal stress protein [Thermodesulfovibrionia bacterium]|nr:universal stress protein [Thermodesulfovibrionia bacterium]